MAGIAQVTLVGNLGKDPEQRFSKSGDVKMTSFSLAVNLKIQGEEVSNWFNVTAFGALGDVCANYLHKGSKVLIIGNFNQRSYDKQDGTLGYSLDVTANTMQMLDTKQQGENGYRPAAAAADETLDVDLASIF